MGASSAADAAARGALLASARALLASGESAAAAAQLETALRRDSGWGRGWLQLGQCQARTGDDDAAAVSFRRAGDDGCDDATHTLATVARENAQLCASRFLPRHLLAWLHDEARTDAWRVALQAAVRDGPPAASVLCGGSTAATSVLHAALAVQAGAARAAAVCGSQLVAGLAAGLDSRIQASAALPLQETPFDVLAWDFGNRLDAGSVGAFCAARAACSAQPRLLPSCVRVCAAVVECAALLELNAVERVAITQQEVAAAGGAAGGDEAFSMCTFSATYTRAVRPVQLQALHPWRVLAGECGGMPCRQLCAACALT